MRAVLAQCNNVHFFRARRALNVRESSFPVRNEKHIAEVVEAVAEIKITRGKGDTPRSDDF